jgi:hypothetical protein
VTIAPYQKLPLGHMVLELNEGRELTGLFTRKYLLQQLRLVLAGGQALAHGVVGSPQVQDKASSCCHLTSERKHCLGPPGVTLNPHHGILQAGQPRSSSTARTR